MTKANFSKKAFSRISVFLILFSQSPIAWLSSNVANADSVDNELKLSAGSSCSISADKQSVYPNLTPSADTYAYIMSMTDKTTNVASSYIYYGGATSTPSCPSGYTKNSLLGIDYCKKGNDIKSLNYNYSLSVPTLDDIITNISLENTGGYEIKFYPLNKNVLSTTIKKGSIINFIVTVPSSDITVSIGDPLLSSVISQGLTTNTWTNLGSLDIPDALENFMNTLSIISPAGTCGIDVVTLPRIISTTYSTTSLTNQPVTVTITMNKTIMTAPAGWMGNADNTVFTKVYSSNTGETVTLTDSLSNSVSVDVSISNIDTTALIGDVSYSTTAPTSGSVTATLSILKGGNPFSAILDTLGWEGFSKTYTENTLATEIVNFHDEAGNTGSVNVNITNIDKTAPVCSIVYSTTTYRFVDVVKATISCNETITVTNNEGKSDFTFIPLFGGDSFTFEYVDNAGNVGTTTANKDGTTAGSCDWTSITTSINGITSAMNSQAFVDMGNNISAIGNLSTNITSLMTQIQSGGTLDTGDLETIQSNINQLSLPNLLATADALNILANALEAINACTNNELINIDTTATVVSLRATATALIDLDTGIKGIQSAFDQLIQPGLKPSEYVGAVSELTANVAIVMNSVKTLSQSWADLTDDMNGLSSAIGGVELLSGLSGLSTFVGSLSSVSDILNTIVSKIDPLIGTIQDISEFTKTLSDLLADIENENLDGAIDNMDLLLKTDLFNTAQQLVIDLAKELQDTLANMEAIKNAMANIPTLNLDGGSMSISSTDSTCESNLTTYQTELANYVATLTPLFDSLIGNIDELENITKLDLENSKITLNTLIANLTELKSNIEGLSPADACANIADLQTMINDTQSKLEIFKSDLENFLNTLDTDMDGLLGKIDTYLELLPEQIREQAKEYLTKLRGILEAELRELSQEATTFLEENKLDAPVLGGLSCTNKGITLEDSVTLPMTSEKSEEVRGYVAIVTGPGDSKQLYVLPGNEVSDLVLDTANIGLYNVNIRTIGKDDLIHTSPVYAFLSDLDLNDGWNTLLSQIAKIIKDAKSEGDNARNKIPGGLKLFIVNLITNVDGLDKDAVLNKLEDIKDGISSVSDVVAFAQDEIDSIGTWTKVSDLGDLQVSDVISSLEKLDALEGESDTPALIKALINPSANYPIYKTTKPEIHDVSVAGIAGEISIQFSGATNVEDRNVVYKTSPENALENGLYTSTFSAGITTGNYVACKSVEIDGCQQEICSEPSIWAVTAINPDTDDDGINDDVDNCVETYNPGQSNIDGDSMGDACDNDDDNDDVLDEGDNCPAIANTDQTDTDEDRLGNECDETPYGEADADNDDVPDLIDNCPSLANSDQTDADNDKVGDMCDNCAQVANANQMDDDADGLGNACDQYNCTLSNGGVETCDSIDNDCDGFRDEGLTFEYYYPDSDGDGYGDNNYFEIGFSIKTADSSRSWDCKSTEEYPVNNDYDCDDNDRTIYSGAVEVANDGIDQDCDGEDLVLDGDDDGIADNRDNCPINYNPDQIDTDEDGVGDTCDGNSCDSTPDVNRAIYKNGRYRAWASPCDGGCSQADPSKVPGWRYATLAEREQRPAQSDFMVDGSLVCAAAQFDNTHQHCDYGNPEMRLPQGGWYELWFVYDCTNNGDADDDTIRDLSDNCPLVANTDQANNDGDTQGDVCDDDDDNDGIDDIGRCMEPSAIFDIKKTTEGYTRYNIAENCIPEPDDNCQFAANPNQEDINQNGIGDACDDICLNIDGVQSTVPSGYTSNENKLCTANGGGGGGGGAGIAITKDVCPNGDYSDSYYDGICGTANIREVISSGEVSNDLISSGSEYDEAYQFALENGITTIPSLEDADMNGYLIRYQMAKMISNFAVNVLGKVPDSTKSCTFGDISKQTEEMKGYIVKSCQLGLMGYESDGITKKANFYPNMYVDRAQFGTILSRLLYGNLNNGGSPFYLKHLEALKEAGIMTMIDKPFMKELRGFVMIMLMRASK